MKRAMTAGLVLTMGLVLTGCGGGGGGGGSTPQATFDGMKAAAAKKDWGGFSAGLTPESQDMMIGAMSMGSAGMPGTDPEKMKGLSEVMTKHGVKPIGLPELMATGGDQAKVMEMMKKVGADVKNKPAAIGEAMAWMDKNLGKDSPFSKDFNADEISASQLQDVKIEGDKATAKIKNKGDKLDDVEFKKVGGKWYMDMSAKMK